MQVAPQFPEAMNLDELLEPTFDSSEQKALDLAWILSRLEHNDFHKV